MMMRSVSCGRNLAGAAVARLRRKSRGVGVPSDGMDLEKAKTAPSLGLVSGTSNEATRSLAARNFGPLMKGDVRLTSAEFFLLYA